MDGGFRGCFECWQDAGRFGGLLCCAGTFFEALSVGLSGLCAGFFAMGVGCHLEFFWFLIISNAFGVSAILSLLGE